MARGIQAAEESSEDRAMGRWWEHRLLRVKELLKLGFKRD